MFLAGANENVRLTLESHDIAEPRVHYCADLTDAATRIEERKHNAQQMPSAQ